MQFVVSFANYTRKTPHRRVRFMKYAVLILLLITITGVPAQPPKGKASPAKKPVAAKPKPVPTPTPTPLTEKEQFDKASAYELAADRVAALEKFIAAFPESENRPAAADLMASSRALIAEEMLISGNPGEAVNQFKRAVEGAPQPIPAELFNETIVKIPATLMRRGQSSAAFELASLIESKVENNTAQLIEIANFYMSLENGAEAMRVAAKAVAKDPTSALAYRTLALAHRINFDLEDSAAAYAKAAELDPATSKRGLAEMKRALGKSDEAVTLYRGMLAANAEDIVARTGLVLALFDAGKRTEAETELTAALEKAPGNFILLAGAAYWYASHGVGNRAIELAETAIKREPRYIWSHIAHARGLISQGKPVAAEQVLIKARAYGNFPTFEYEIASARLAAGFYQDAAEDLAKYFTVSSGGVKTNLGFRVAREEKSFLDLVSYERKASIFIPESADSVENSDTLRALLDLNQKLQATTPNEDEIAAAADAFVKGSDKMKLHRQIYAASALLQKRIALAKVLEITKAAAGTTDAALEVASPGSSVMASELYESRIAAFRKSEFLVVPDVPKPTLSAILRGRIEEIAGWTLYQQGNYPDAIVRLRRAVSVMPDKSAWWRSSVWRLGAALAADGKDAEALNYYIESYKTDKPDFAKYAVVESLYRKVNGSMDGLETKIGAQRVAILQQVPEGKPSPAPSETPVSAPTTDATQQSMPVTTDPAVNSKTEPPKPTAENGDITKPASTEKVTELKTPVTDAKVESPPEKPLDIPKTETKVETKPEIKTEPRSETVVPEKQVEKPPDTKPADPQPQASSSTGKETDPAPKSATPKPLFEPIIITIPNSRPRKSAADTSAEQKKSTTEENVADPTNKPAVTSTGAERPRVIGGQEVTLDEPAAPCSVEFSQNTVSLINDGGSVGILVTLKGAADIKNLIASSGNPKDISVTPEPEITGFPNRRFYVIKSISPALGMYQVSFVAPCGKKDIMVTVR
jgi:tetratricopeptide (TPR) repeat protein